MSIHFNSSFLSPSNPELYNFDPTLNPRDFSCLTFLNKENGGPGRNVLYFALTASVLAYVIPKIISKTFPETNDQYPASATRSLIGRKFRSSNVLKVASCIYKDALFISIFMAILMYPEVQQKGPRKFIALIHTGCAIGMGSRIILHSLLLNASDKGPSQTSLVFNKLAKIAKPSLFQ